MPEIMTPTLTSAATAARARIASTAATMSLVVLTTACGGADDPSSRSAATTAEDTALGHVHGLGVDPGDGSLYVASHLGVFRVARDGTPERVADR